MLQLEANFADIADITSISPDILRFREYKILSHESLVLFSLTPGYLDFDFTSDIADIHSRMNNYFKKL